MIKDWYSPAEIVFDRKITLWLIQNLGSLRAGYYPSEPSGYTDTTPIGKNLSHKAPFITAAECFIEVSTRLEKCGIDGLILLAIECWGENETSLSRYLRMAEWSVEKRYKKALSYVASGPARRWLDTKKRKGQTYREWGKKK